MTRPDTRPGSRTPAIEESIGSWPRTRWDSVPLSPDGGRSVRPPDSLPIVPTTFTGKNAWLNEVRPWQWLEMLATLVAFFSWLTAVLALGAERPLAGILLGFIPGVMLVHIASWFLPMVFRAQGLP